MHDFDEYKRLGERNILKNRDLLIKTNGNDTANDTAKQQNDTVNPQVDAVFDLIKKDPKLTAAELTEKSGLSIATVKRHIKKLKENGKIERIGSDKTGYWKVRK